MSFCSALFPLEHLLLSTISLAGKSLSSSSSMLRWRPSLQAQFSTSSWFCWSHLVPCKNHHVHRCLLLICHNWYQPLQKIHVRPKDDRFHCDQSKEILSYAGESPPKLSSFDSIVCVLHLLGHIVRHCRMYPYLSRQNWNHCHRLCSILRKYMPSQNIYRHHQQQSPPVTLLLVFDDSSQRHSNNSLRHFQLKRHHWYYKSCWVHAANHGHKWRRTVYWME